MVELGTVLDLERALKLLAAEAAEKVNRFREYARAIDDKELTEIWDASGHDPRIATELIYRMYTTEKDPEKNFAMSDGKNWILDIMNGE